MFCKQTFIKLLLVTYRTNCLSVRWKSEVRITKQLKKMMTKGPKKKAWYMQPTPVAPDIMSQPVRKGPTEGQRRRAVQVGKVLYGYIVDIVNSGELCPQLAEMAVCIDRVNVVPDFSAINVHWLSSGNEDEDKIENMLRENAGKLRHILTTYHLLGRIPIINFVKDDTALRSLEVERLLSIADFGPDFQPTTYTTQIRTRTGKSDISKFGPNFQPEPHVTGKSDIVSDFKKLSLQHTDSKSYPNIMTVSNTGALVYENTQTETKADSVKEFGATKEHLNSIEKDVTAEQRNYLEQKGITDEDVMTEQRNMVEKQKGIIDRDLATQITQLDTDAEEVIKAHHDERAKSDDMGEVKLRNDIYALQYDSLIKKLVMKKRRAKHRMSADLIASDVKESEAPVPSVKPNYGQFLRKQRKVKRMKGKIPYTVHDYLRDEGTDYWNILPKEKHNYRDEFSDEES